MAQKTNDVSLNKTSKAHKESFGHYFKKNNQLYMMIIPGMICLIMFQMVPIFWNAIAFQNFSVTKGIFASDWIGFDNFVKFFHSPYFVRLIGNTFMLGFVSILFAFPVPIIFALLLNEVKHTAFKRTTQTISYIPYFISTVVVIGLFKEMLSINDGVVNNLIAALGGDKIYFFGEPSWFRAIYTVTGLWSGMGYNSIIYLSAISAVNPELYESAVIDGANRLDRAIHITLPCIAPTIVILFIMNIGNIVSSDVAKVLLIYSPLTYETADVIGTYVYREGIQGGSYSYTTAINLFTSVISLVFVLSTNYISKKLSDTSLF